MRLPWAVNSSAFWRIPIAMSSSTPSLSALRRMSWLILTEQKWGPAHRAEMGGLDGGRGEGLVVERAGGVRVEGQVELVFPTEFESGVGHRVVPGLRAGVALGQVGGVGGDLVGDHSSFDVVAVREPEVFFGVT